MEHMCNATNTIHDTGCGAGCACATKDATIPQSAAESRPARTYLPAVDLLHEEGKIFLIVDIPGVPQDGVDLQMEKNVLTLRATPTDGTVAGKRLAYAEYGVGQYERSFVLPENIERDSITASLNNGVLRISLTKAAPATRRIAVN